MEMSIYPAHNPLHIHRVASDYSVYVGIVGWIYYIESKD